MTVILIQMLLTNPFLQSGLLEGNLVEERWPMGGRGHDFAALHGIPTATIGWSASNQWGIASGICTGYLPQVDHFFGL